LAPVVPAAHVEPVGTAARRALTSASAPTVRFLSGLVAQRGHRAPKRLSVSSDLVTLAQDRAEFLRLRLGLDELELPIVQAVIFDVERQGVRAQVGDRIVCALPGTAVLGARLRLEAAAHPHRVSSGDREVVLALRPIVAVPPR
jgi:hypothetical protein